MIDSPDAEADLRDAWRSLAEIRGNPFLTPEWFDSWRLVADIGSDAAIVTVRRDSRLIGVLPLAGERLRGESRLRFAGAAFGDCFHPVCVASDEELVAEAAGSVLGARRWSSLELNHGLSGSRWGDRLIEAAGAHGPRITYGPEILPYVDFGGLDWDGYLAARSRNFRKGLWRQMRRLQERGRVSFRLADESTLEADLESFFELHDLRWGAESRFLDARSRRFHTAHAQASLTAGSLRLGSLELDGVTVASTLGWRLGSRFSEFQRGYDIRLRKLGPGRLVMGEMMRTLNEEGAQIYDQLLGDEAYKLQIADGSRVAETVRAARPRRINGALIRAERAARPVYSRVPADFRDKVRARRGQTT